MEITYPTLRPAVIQPLLDLKTAFHDNADVLGADCPYDNDTIELLQSLFAVVTLEAEIREVEIAPPDRGGAGRPLGGHVLKKLRTESADAVEAELITVRKDLEALREGAKKLAPNDQIAIIKASVGLIEKLSVLAERQFNIKRMAQFQTVVLSILDDLLGPDDRAVFLARMAPFADSE